MRKHINSKTRQYVDILTEDWVLDDKPEVGSMNAVTSDGVAKAVAEAGSASYSAGSGINIEGSVLSVKADGTTVTFNASSELTAVIPEQVNADWNSESGVSRILNKPDLSLKEDVANKKQSIDSASQTDYPSSKAVADFVSDAVSSNSADYISDNGQPFSSAQALPTDPTVVGNNDYAIVLDNGIYYRYKATVANNTVTWALEYQINTSPLSQAQLNAVNSGIDATKVGTYDSHVADSVIHVTSADKTAWNGKQDAINDLADIRSGAALGATAVQDQNYVHTDNNFTSALKNKLDGIEAGAEVNVQPNWLEGDTGADSYIQNKPQNLVQDASYVHTDNNFTTSLKTKLEGIESGAQVNVKPNWNAAAGSDSEILNRPDLSVYATTSAMNTALGGKQDTLTAGTNISISSNVISATDTTYSAGTGLTLSGTTFNVDKPVPAPSSLDTDKVLGVTDAQGSYGWVPAPSGVDVHTVSVKDNNPYGLKGLTWRVKFDNTSYSPESDMSGYADCVQVSSSPNIWDVTFQSAHMSYMGQRFNPYDLWYVMDTNLYGVTDLSYMFANCSLLKSVSITNLSDAENLNFAFVSCSNLTEVNLPSLDSAKYLEYTFYSCENMTTPPVLTGLNRLRSMDNIFRECSRLESVPQFNGETLPALINVSYAFDSCRNVSGGAYDLYDKLQNLGHVSYTDGAFYNCGRDTVQGRADLARIPATWGGDNYNY